MPFFMCAIQIIVLLNYEQKLDISKNIVIINFIYLKAEVNFYNGQSPY